MQTIRHKIALLPVVATLLAAFTLSLCSCMVNYGRTPDGAQYFTNTIGVDADDFNVTPAGTHIKGLNESKSLMYVADKIEKMWANYLIYKGLVFLGGKYYDHQGKIVDADTSVKLEELHNAKSEAEAASKIKELELLSKQTS